MRTRRNRGVARKHYKQDGRVEPAHLCNALAFTENLCSEVSEPVACVHTAIDDDLRDAEEEEDLSFGD